MPFIINMTEAEQNEPIKTRDLKKGDWVKLRNGWCAQKADNVRNVATPMFTVYGFYTEIGSVYAWDIEFKLADDTDPEGMIWNATNHIELTPKQKKIQAENEAFWG